MFETHPHNILKYCPKCGAHSFVPQKDNSLICEKCGFHFYYNAASSVAAIIIDEQGRLLLTRRGINPKKGTLDLPGGFVSEDESSEAALKREIMEELNAEVVDYKYIRSYPNRYEYSGMTVFTNDAAFVCTLRDYSHLKADDDVAAFMWVDPSSLDTELIGIPSIRKMVQDYINENMR